MEIIDALIQLGFLKELCMEKKNIKQFNLTNQGKLFMRKENKKYDQVFKLS